MPDFGDTDASVPSATATDAPHLPRQVPIDAHGDGGFRFAGLSHRGSLLCLPSGIWAWPITTAADVTPESFSRVFSSAADLDFFIFGTGDELRIVPAALRQMFRDAGISLDAMGTGAAVRTYNVMLMENRRVGAALIAVE